MQMPLKSFFPRDKEITAAKSIIMYTADYRIIKIKKSSGFIPE